MKFNPFAISSYLAFRYIVDPRQGWTDKIKPNFPDPRTQGKYGVKESADTREYLEQIVAETIRQHPDTGLLLSGGIDSAILAAMLPAGTRAYSIKFIADGAIDETVMAGKYAEANKIDLQIIDVTWDNYLESIDKVLLHKKSPLHAVEVGLYVAAKKANADGLKTLMLGIGADSTFGGMNKLLSKDWTFDEFVARYTFIDPSTAAKEPVSMIPTYEKYRTAEGFDVIQFLKVTHGLGIIQAFENAIGAAGCSVVSPFEELFLDAPLDIERIRKSESKYILRKIFNDLYPDIILPEKIPFARPVDQWLKYWEGPTRSEFLDELKISDFNGEQKWQLYNMERFMNLMEEEDV